MRPKMRRATALLLGPRRDALSGVSTHVSLLLKSRLAQEFALIHFEVGGEGRNEGALGRAARLIVSPVRLAAAVLARRAVIVHLNTALTVRAYWRDLVYAIVAKLCGAKVLRSEERRVGKECRSGWSSYHETNKSTVEW